MATATQTTAADDWVQIPATWGAYLRLLKAKGDKFWPKYTYCDGRLTIVSPSTSHEFLKMRLSGLVEDLFVGLGIDYLPSGSVTLKAGVPKRKGTEPDTSYYLTNLEQIRDLNRGWKNLPMSMNRFPPPDLVVEMVFSRPVEDTLKVHAAFRTREIWVGNDQGLTCLILGERGSYHESASSACLPFLPLDEFSAWVYRQDVAREVDLRRQFRRWVETDLAPRFQTGG